MQNKLHLSLHDQERPFQDREQLWDVDLLRHDC